MVMVDRLEDYTETQSRAGLLITSDNIFTEAGHFTSAGIIEHMAQTIALHTGYQFYLQGVPAPVGYIGALKNVQIIKRPKVGSIISTTAEISYQFMTVTLVNVVTSVAGEVIATATMKTVLAE